MKLLNSLKKAILDLYSSVKRFPATIVLAAATSVLLIVKSEIQQKAGHASTDMLTRVIMTLALGIPLSLCIKLIFERNESFKKSAKVLMYLAGVVLLVFYYSFLLKDFKMISVTRYISVSLALYLTFIFLPYIFRRDNFELYVIKLFTRFLVTLVYSAVLFAGISAILFTIDKLLAVYVPGKTYQYVWFMVAGIFAPSFFLAGVPKYNQVLQIDDYPKLLKILLLYIVMPIIAVYTTILYMFFAKSIITREWPVGLVAHLVIWYSVITTAVIFLISPFKRENTWAKAFIFWFTKVIIPVLLIMFASIGIRVRAYGITENRYFVIVLGLWVLGIMVYLNFVKNKRNIVMPVSLAVIAAISVLGPLSAYSISKLSQNNRLQSILSKYDMIKNNAIVKSSYDVSGADKNEISQILMYFSNSHSFSDVKYLPDDFSVDSMESVFGFPYELSYYGNISNRYFSYFADRFEKPVDISKYDYLFDFRNYGQEMTSKENNLEIRYSIHDQETQLRIFHAGKEIYNTSLSEFVNQIRRKYPVEKGTPISPEEMTFTDQNDRINIKFVIFNVDGEEFPGTGKVKINNINFYLLVKVK